MAANAEIGSPQPDAEIPSLGRGRLRQFLAYAKQVFGLAQLLDAIHDRRQQPRVPTSLVARVVFFVGLLRIRSFNALDPKLGEAAMQYALGALN